MLHVKNKISLVMGGALIATPIMAIAALIWQLTGNEILTGVLPVVMFVAAYFLMAYFETGIDKDEGLDDNEDWY